MSSEKLAAAHQLVQEQLELEHIEPSNSPWNTPIFVIKKRSGKWRLLHDLRAINAQMKIFGPLQHGLPLPSALPSDWQTLIVDIKDCFFSIPLCPQDRERFAFTLPTINHMGPDKRYQWKVLPQGMANSPTMCQLFVQQALEPVQEQFHSLIIIHYMDDILLCGKNQAEVYDAFDVLVKSLRNHGLIIAPEKVQSTQVGQFLGTIICPKFIKPQKIEIRRDHLHTLNDFQKLMGDINWLCPFLKLSTTELKPLFDILEGDSHLTSPRTMTPEALTTLKRVEQVLSEAQLLRIVQSQPFHLCVLQTAKLPTAVLWQHGPLLWIHPNASPAKTIEWYPAAVAKLALKGLKAAVTHFGSQPQKLITPYTTEQLQVLAATNDYWAILVTAFQGQFDNHYPKHPILNFAQSQPLIFPRVTRTQPIPEGAVVYTDGSKSGTGAYVHEGKTTTIQFDHTSPQLTECQVVLEVLKNFPGPLNIVSDSSYVVNAVNSLETVGMIKMSSTVASIFQEIQNELLSRSSPIYITHIRAHSGLPGPMAKGNQQADRATRIGAFVIISPLEAAAKFHSQFHVTSETLRRRFSLTRSEARNIVLQCHNCAEFLPTPHVGINPRGLRPLQIWQMDVTHVTSFGRLKYLHVSVDTCSGIIFASPLSGEKTTQVIQHCLEAWSAWGLPQILKTDNGPAYTATKFKQFCQQMGVTHITGLPYNPQGQGIVERAHHTLKTYIIKQKEGLENVPLTPKTIVSVTLFTLNF